MSATAERTTRAARAQRLLVEAAVADGRRQCAEELAARLRQADGDLRFLAERTRSRIRKPAFEKKAEGVRMALEFVDEELRAHK